VLSFNGTDQNGSGAAPAGPAHGVENGGEGAALGILPSPRRVVRDRLRVLLKPLGRSSREHTLRRVESAERRSVTWSSPEELQVELSRSRRYGHPFALVRVPCGQGEKGGSNGREEVALAISLLLRRVDRTWPDGTSVYLLLPDCDREMGQAMLARIREPLSEVLSEEELVAISCVAFPADGFTSGALFDALDGRSMSRSTRPALVGDPSPTPEAPLA
jgi:hypothetical protein